jgi:hypothetical protein
MSRDRSFLILAALGIVAAACACSALLGAYPPIELTDGGAVPADDAGRPTCDGGKAAAVDAGSTVADAGSPVADAGSSGPPVVVTLALFDGIPNGMAIGGNEVFWTSTGSTGDGGRLPAGIWEVSVDGGAITVLATSAPGTVPWAVALDATNVYWTVTSYNFSNDGGLQTNQTNILSTPRGGGPTTVLLSGTTVSFGLAVDETSIYWGNAAESAVMKMPLNGGAATTLASGLTLPQNIGAQTIAVDSTSVYWATQDAIMKLPLACGTPVSLAPAVGAVALTVDATSVYLAGQGLDCGGQGCTAVQKVTPK